MNVSQGSALSNVHKEKNSNNPATQTPREFFGEEKTQPLTLLYLMSSVGKP